MSAQRPVLFGGSFNPVHEAHLALIRGLLARADVSRVYVVPAALSPFKQESAPLPAELRLRMLRLALGGFERVCVLDLEVRREPPSYTIDTMVALGAAHPQAAWRIAMGCDTYLGFARWHRAGDLLRLAGLLVVARAGMVAPFQDDPQRWRMALPPPWCGEARVEPDGRIIARDGRVLVEYAALNLPDDSSTRIRLDHAYDRVPAPARELLLAYERTLPRP